jgi:hypothetical protein
MVHTAPPSRGRRRVELVLGASLALVGLVVAVVAIVALNHPKGKQAAHASGVTSSSASRSASPSKAPSKTPTKSKAPPPASSTKAQGNGQPALLVLNNSDTSGLADTAVSRFKAAGWTATNGGNFSGDILSTAAYYDPSVDGAKAGADALQQQFPSIKRVVERFDGLPQGPIVVVLTTDYS